MVKNIDLLYQNCFDRLASLWEKAKNAFVKSAFFHHPYIFLETFSAIPTVSA